MRLFPNMDRLLMAGFVAMVPASFAFGGDSPAGAPTYREVRDFLVRHTKVVEMTDGAGARLAICPEYQGRVMTSTCGGLSGPSFGFINREFIEAGKNDPHFNNYGGEDRLWLAPEGGQFSLWFAPGAEQNLDNWFTPAALNDGAFDILSKPDEPFYRLGRSMKFQNTSKTQFDLGVSREIHLLSTAELGKMFGPVAAATLGAGNVKTVAYQTVNTITNQGAAFKKETGLVSMWMLGMFSPGAETVIIVPYKPGDEKELGPVVKSDYFGSIPPERLKITPEAILFRADGNYRSKIGTSQKRCKPVAGSIDFRSGVLTLVHYNMPADPTADIYLNNAWELPQKEPYKGDVLNSYNDGPPEPGKKSMGGFYELETLSPAALLATGQSLTHRHSTIHVEGDLATLAKLAQAVLGVDLEKVRREMPLK
ncbi:MAG: DUF6786 family protein [Pirellulales bacterium]